MVSVSAYAPGSGDGISGGKVNAAGQAPVSGDIACPYNIPLGWTAEIETQEGDFETLVEIGAGPVFTCMDRLHKNYGTGHADIAVVDGAPRERIALAKQWGRRNRMVIFRCAESAKHGRN